jgi:hypothetical protein
MAKKFDVVNPIILDGNNDSNVYTAKTPIEAAQKVWKALTKNVGGHSSKFLFSLKEMNGGALHHFEVKENIKDQSYKIQKFDANIKEKHFDTFRDNVMEHADNLNEDVLSGGEKSSDSSSDSSSTASSDAKSKVKHRPRRRRHSSSSSSDQYPTFRTRINTPIFNYFPSLYTSPIYNTTLNPQLVVRPVIIPRFISPVVYSIFP